MTENDAWNFELDNEGDCTVTIEGDSHDTETWANEFDIDVEVDSGGSNAGSGGGDDDDNSGTSASGELSIYSAPDEVVIAPGSTETITVKVRNTLNVDFSDVNLYVDYIEDSWYTGPYEKDVDSGETVSYSVTFNIPSDADIKNYSIKFVANTSAVTDRKTATLAVMGEPVEEVESDVSGYEIRYDTLAEILSDAEAQGKDVADSKTLLDQAKEKIDKANAYLAAGDTTNAEALYSEINDLLTQAEDKLGVIKLKQLTETISDWYGAVAIGVIIVLGAIVYLVKKPYSGYTPGQGYKHVPSHRRGRSPIDKILEKLKRKRH